MTTVQVEHYRASPSIPIFDQPVGVDRRLPQHRRAARVPQSDANFGIGTLVARLLLVGEPTQPIALQFGEQFSGKRLLVPNRIRSRGYVGRQWSLLVKSLELVLAVTLDQEFHERG